jgi:hypothetical protein
MDSINKQLTMINKYKNTLKFEALIWYVASMIAVVDSLIEVIMLFKQLANINYTSTWEYVMLFGIADNKYALTTTFMIVSHILLFSILLIPMTSG